MFPRSATGNVPGFFMQAMLQVLRTEGISVFERAPALDDPAEFAYTEAQLRELLDSLARYERPLGLLIGERITESNLHVAGVLVTVSRTLQDAYQHCQSVVEHAQSTMAGVLELRGPIAAWVLRPSNLGVVWDDLMLSICFHVARRFLIGTQSSSTGFADAIEVHVARPRPANAAEYERCFQGRVRFDAPVSELTFPRSLLDLPRPGVDGSLATDMREALLRRVVPPPTTAQWSERVQAALRERAKLADVDFERLAARWGTSLRTLRRRIASEGRTLTELLDEVRFERARYLLENTPAPQAEIAEALGYADETSFRRAFKRWSGESPSDHRRVGRTG